MSGSTVIRKSSHGQMIGQIGCFQWGGTCVRAALRVNRTRQFRGRRRGPFEAHLLPLSPLRFSAAPHLSRSRHLLPKEKSTLALRDGAPGRWWDAIEWKAWRKTQNPDHRRPGGVDAVRRHDRARQPWGTSLGFGESI